MDAQLVLAHDRLASSSDRTDAINDATKTYQTKIAKERDTITTWSAVQAAAQAAYDNEADTAAIVTGAPPFVGGLVGGVTTVVFGAINLGLQEQGEEKKGNAEKQLALSAADSDKALALADTDQNLFQAGEGARNVEREKQSQVLTMQDNEFVRNQELERRDGLLRELQQALVLRDQNNSDLAGRYYADPIHYLRAQNNMLRADLAFRSAQRWVFFLLRALEYTTGHSSRWTAAPRGNLLRCFACGMRRSWTTWSRRFARST